MPAKHEFEPVSGIVVDAAIRVHSELGPGLLENAYEACLAYELHDRGLRAERQVPQPVMYRGRRVDLGYRIDLLVEESFIVELKTVTTVHPIHRAQLLSHLKLGGFRSGLLINFHVPRLRDGIVRMVNRF
jgi:GxxExxY protein